MAVRGDGQNFPLRESYPQWYPPHCSPPTWSPTGYVGRVRGDGRVLPSPGGSGGGRIYDRNKTCRSRSSKTLLRGTAAYWEPLRSLHVESCTYNTRQVQSFFKVAIYNMTIYDRPGKILPKSIFFLILVIDIFPFCKCIGGGLFWNWEKRSYTHQDISCQVLHHWASFFLVRAFAVFR